MEPSPTCILRISLLRIDGPVVNIRMLGVEPVARFVAVEQWERAIALENTPRKERPLFHIGDYIKGLAGDKAHWIFSFSASLAATKARRKAVDDGSSSHALTL